MTILMISPGKTLAAQVQKALGGLHDVQGVHSLPEALTRLTADHFDVILAHLDLPDCQGLDIYLQVQAKRPECPVIVVAPRGDNRGYEAVQDGAQDYLYEDEIEAAQLKHAIDCAVARHQRRNLYSSDSELLENLIENIPDRIYFKDLGSRFIKISRSMANLFGLPQPADAVGKTDFEFFPEQDAQRMFDDEQHVLLTGEPIIGKIEEKTLPDSSSAWTLTTKLPLRDKGGRTRGTFGISADITRLQQTEAALQEERNRLREASEELLRKNMQLEADLEMAREIQQALLPRAYPSFPRDAAPERSRLRFSHRYSPTQGVGGDFFSVFPVSESKAGVLICDVMGHGARAALVTAVMKGLSEELQALSDEPGKFLESLNRNLRSVLAGVEDPTLCTGFYMTLDSNSGVAEFATAGHPSPVHIDRTIGKATPLARYDGRHGPVLGLYNDASYPTCRCETKPGDLIILFTDGLYEVACGPAGEEFGMDRLLRAFEQRARLSPDALIDGVLAEVGSECGEHFEDDVCLLSVERSFGAA